MKEYQVLYIKGRHVSHLFDPVYEISDDMHEYALCGVAPKVMDGWRGNTKMEKLYAEAHPLCNVCLGKSDPDWLENFFARIAPPGLIIRKMVDTDELNKAIIAIASHSSSSPTDSTPIWRTSFERLNIGMVEVRRILRDSLPIYPEIRDRIAHALYQGADKQ